MGAGFDFVPYAILMFWCKMRSSCGLRRSTSFSDSAESDEAAEDVLVDVEETGREETRASAAT